ncbi:MAG: hypothetical protein Q8Q09_20260 [Deltaproteobacteria bacterium]|nr:hypothetical protein [Deltaproteobacteria bacterium]
MDEEEKRYDVMSLADLLAPAVGNERARAAVLSALGALGIKASSMGAETVQKVFAYLATQGGLTGAASRRAAATLRVQSRAGTHGLEDQAVFTRSSRQTAADEPLPLMSATPRAMSDRPASPSTEAGDMISRRELATLLAHAIGAEQALSVVERTCKTMSFGESGTVADGLRVLERIAQEPGLVGITARFAKARFALRVAS